MFPVQSIIGLALFIIGLIIMIVGQAATLTVQRQAALRMAYEAHPERFVNGLPKPPEVPTEVWINPPRSDEQGGS